MLLAGTSLFCIVTLGLFNAWIVRHSIDISADRTTNPPDQANVIDRMVDVANVERSLQVLDTVARPLFSPTRRGDQAKLSEPVNAEAASINQEKPDIGFFGTSQVNGEIKALVALDEGTDLRWSGVGQSVGQWKIVSIKQDKIVIALKDKKAVVSLYPQDADDGR